MSTGIGGQIALARIGSLFSDVNTVNIWQNFVSETLDHTLEELEEGSITGRYDAPTSHKGLDYATGEVNMEPNPNALSYWLKGWFGTLATSLVTAAGSTGANSGENAGLAQYHHTFTPRVSPFSDRTFLEPHNLMVYRDVGSAWLYKGAIFPTLKIDIEAQQLTKATATVMARSVDRIQRTAAIQSLTSGGGRPWVWDMASLELSSNTASANLAQNTFFEKLSMTFDLPMEGAAFIDGTKKYGEFSPSDFRRVTFEGTMSFRDQQMYDQFVAYEARRMRITLLNVNSNIALGNVASLDASAFLGYFGMRIHFPRFKLLSFSAPISGPNRLTASFTAKAEYDEVSGVMAQVEVVNTVSSAALTTAY